MFTKPNNNQKPTFTKLFPSHGYPHSPSSILNVLPPSFILVLDVTADIALGAQFVVFNQDSVLFDGVPGYWKLSTADDANGVLMRHEDVHIILSMGKLAIDAPFLALLILERNLVKKEMGLAGIVAEFRKGSWNLVIKILLGFEPVTLMCAQSFLAILANPYRITFCCRSSNIIRMQVQ